MGFRCSAWSRHKHLGHARSLSFRHPINFFIGPKATYCQQTQMYRVYRGEVLVIETTQEMTDIPYGDYFRVEVRWEVERSETSSFTGRDSCNLRISVNVPFSKKTVLKSQIEKNTLDESRESYTHWLREAQSALLEAQTSETPMVANSAEEAVPDSEADATTARVLTHIAERRIPAEYESEIRRMLNLKPGDGQVAPGNLVSTLHSGKGGASGQGTPVGGGSHKSGSLEKQNILNLGTKRRHQSWYSGTTARLSNALGHVGPRLTIIHDRMWSNLKFGIVVGLALLIILLQVWILWSTLAVTHGGIAEGSNQVSFTSRQKPVEGEGRGHDMQDVAQFWEQRMQFLREDVAILEARLQGMREDLLRLKTALSAVPSKGSTTT
eukprot:TRINITY_DN8165_c0_g1_i1.p1 TRINITY_DN8165_c0_g1~~TRINITY_DN8165_c0_g1_i1.p1  ORF type:complete len:381 (+),score=54.34 TRINITY_DN8165_c0_g1_i1:1-1143(+)